MGADQVQKAIHWILWLNPCNATAVRNPSGHGPFYSLTDNRYTFGRPWTDQMTCTFGMG
jgi:hypothetical protein